MVYSINGFGSTYYGRRGIARDGSYTTTKWAIAATLPLFPMGNIRVRERSAGFSGRDLQVVQELGMDWIQILTTYAYTYLLIPLALYLTIVPDAGQRGIIRDYGDVPWWLAFFLQASPVIAVALLPHVLRWIAAWRVKR